MKKLLIQLLLLTSCFAVYTQESKLSFTLDGQLIGWTNLNIEDPLQNQWGLKYIPDILTEYQLNEKWKLDAELAINAYSSFIFSEGESDGNSDISPYRMWLRLSSSNFELRVGLQKINFGSASMIRPLMWFDEIDPRDPLQLTDGVYGLLARYYFLNNANLWVWILYGNDELKAWEYVQTSERTAEFGGRIQLPVFNGEAGLSYHHRKAGPLTLSNGALSLETGEFFENRLGLDGKWNLGVGLWYEYVIRNREEAQVLPKWENYLNMGIDYTFSLGNGLGISAEHFINQSSEELWKDGSNNNFTALNLNYPIGIIDNISSIIYYNWESNDWYRFLNYQRQYDKWSFYIMAYWNPESYNIYQNLGDTSLFSGKGFQVMAVFNH